MTKEEHMFYADSMPCNSIPFLNRLLEILGEAQTNSFQSLEGSHRAAARGCMWILMAQLYGQLATIDMCDEWDNLRKLKQQREELDAVCRIKE